jgi:hypothetical protein
MVQITARTARKACTGSISNGKANPGRKQANKRQIRPQFLSRADFRRILVQAVPQIAGLSELFLAGLYFSTWLAPFTHVVVF